MNGAKAATGKLMDSGTVAQKDARLCGQVMDNPMNSKKRYSRVYPQLDHTLPLCPQREPSVVAESPKNINNNQWASKPTR